MEVGFRKDFNLLVLTIIKKVEVKSILGKTKSETLIQGVAAADDILDANDILVLYGSRKDLHFFLRHKLE
jgi:trk system potassium uptake protein TrkA